MTLHLATKKMSKNGHCCSGHFANPSVHQSMDEMEFERGIWSAALNDDLSGVQKHLDRGISPNATDGSGYSALHYASRTGSKEICNLLLVQGARPNLMTRSGRVTSLHRAAYKGHIDIAKLLLRYGADPTLQDSDGKTSLHKAIEEGHHTVAELLLSHCPKCASIPDNKGRQPVDLVSSDITNCYPYLTQM